MPSSDNQSILRLQTSLFGALVGVLVGKTLVSRGEIAVALNLMIDAESDPVTRELLLITSRMIDPSLADAGPVCLRLI